MAKHITFFIFFVLSVRTAAAQNLIMLDSLNRLYRQTNRDTIQSLVLAEIAALYRPSRPDTTQYIAYKGLIFAKKIKFDRGIAINLNLLGVAELNKGNYFQSITYLFEGLEINKKLNIQKDISTNLNNIGEVYRLQENYAEATKYYNQALFINKKIAYKEGVAIILNNLGEIKKDQAQYELALDYFFKSLKICEEIKNESRAALRLNNIGEVYAKQNKYTDALKFLFDAIKLSAKFDNKLHLTREFNNVANSYLKTNDNKKALDYALQSLEVAKGVNAKKEIATSLKTIAEIYQKKQDYYNTFIYYQAFITYKDSLSSDEVTKKIKEVQFDYEMSQKKKEILLLEAEKNLQEQSASTRLLYNILFGISLLFLMALAAALYQKNKFKKIANAILESKNKATENQNKELNKALVLVESQKTEIAMQIANFEGANAKLKTNEEIIKKSYIKLKENESKIKEQNAEMLTQNKELFQQQEELSIINTSLEITFKELKSTSDRLSKSIQYANQIQQLILPKKEKVDSFFNEHFVIYLPKDVVSGDFYWFTLLKDNKAIFILADCTGHGVPGAFMSMIGNTLLHEIIKVKNINSPAEILLELHKGIRNVLKQKESKNSDGMDISVCLFEKNVEIKTCQVTFAGAKSNLFYVKNKLIYQLDGSKATIGGFAEKPRTFINQVFTLKEGEIIYFMSDGYIDQNNFNRERFSSNKFKQLLNVISYLSIKEQKQAMLTALKEHQQSELQRDDISVVGIRL